MKQVIIQSEDDIHLLAKKLDWHIFRGQRQQEWPIKSKLARLLESIPIERGNYRNRENNVIREFGSRINLYEKIAFSPNDRIGCCSLMQHYGAPTRLIDFTASLYVALFFAVDDIEYKGDSAIWCLNEMLIRDKAVPREKIRSADGNDKQCQYQEMLRHANDLLLSDAENCPELLIIDPPIKNERLSRQQGCFLFPRRIDKSLNDILASDFSCSSSFEDCPASMFDKLNNDELALKIIVPANIRQALLGLLWKMNISHELLFPGMDGFCKSMFFHCTLQ